MTAGRTDAPDVLPVAYAALADARKLVDTAHALTWRYPLEPIGDRLAELDHDLIVTMKLIVSTYTGELEVGGR